MARHTSFSSVVRGEKIRKEFAELRRRHRAAATIQSQVKSKIARKQYKGIADASVLIQSGKRVYFCTSWVLLIYSLRRILSLFSSLILNSFNLFAVIRGWLVRRCSGDIGWLKSGGTKVKGLLYSASYLLSV